MDIERKEHAEGKKIILIVEDDIFLLKIYQAKFEKEGIEVWTARDGKEALSFLAKENNAKEKPSLVILDLMLPLVSGFDVLEAMRKDEKWKNVPVVILTNLGQPQDREHGKKLGVVDYIVKTDARIGDVVEEVKKYLKLTTDN